MSSGSEMYDWKERTFLFDVRFDRLLFRDYSSIAYKILSFKKYQDYSKASKEEIA